MSMEVLGLIDKLEAMVSQSRRMPITGQAILDSDRLAEIIDQVRLALPREVQEAHEVLERREQILEQTKLDARRLKASAENESRSKVEESELVASAKRRSEEIIAEAQGRAERLIAAAEGEARQRRAGADEYAQDVLAKLEEEVTSVLSSISNGRRVLSPEERIAAAS